jgi:hypothetical protein
VLAGVRQGLSWSSRRSRGGAGRTLQEQPASQVLQQQQQQPPQHQSSDWRLLHHARWQQQQQSEADVSSSPAGSSGGDVQPSRFSSWEAAPVAAGSGQQPGSERGSKGGTGGMSARALLLDVGLQLVLAATAAGLYFVLSRGERSSSSSKLRASFWRK